MSTNEPTQNSRNFGEAVGEHVRIFQREGNGIWYANYQHAGKQIRVSLKTKNKKQAIKEAMKLDIQLQEGTYQQKTETKSITEAVELYLTQHVNGLKKQTKKDTHGCSKRCVGSMHPHAVANSARSTWR